MFIRLIKIISVIILIMTSNNLYANAISKQAAKIADKACEKAGVKLPDTPVDIQLAAFTTIDNMLPIKVAGTEFGGDDTVPDPDSDSDKINSKFLCMCKMPPPIFERIGITVSFWNNIGLIDTTSIPYCMPQIGMGMAEEMADTVEDAYGSFLKKPVGLGGSMQFGERSSAGKEQDQFISAHVHFTSYMSFMQIISAVLTAACLNVETNFPFFATELLATWQNDEWGVLTNPEALLVANPIATAACMADSFSVSLTKRSLDPLFWCAGSWGVMYPFTMNVGSGVPLNSYAMLATRAIAQKFQTLQLLDTTGSHMVNNTCQPIPTYFMPKKDINIYPIFPHKIKKRFPIGYPSEIWGIGLDNPANLGVMTWMVYQKRDCCYL